jgi:hypothetical protein
VVVGIAVPSSVARKLSVLAAAGVAIAIAERAVRAIRGVKRIESSIGGRARRTRSRRVTSGKLAPG